MDRILCNSQALHADFQPRPSYILIFRVHTPLGCPLDHKGHDLRDGRGKPDAGQLQQRRQEQERQPRTDRLGIHKEIKTRKMDGIGMIRNSRFLF